MARLPRRRWATRHLVVAWCAYWLVLVVAVLGRPALLTWRLSHDAGSHGGASASITNDVVALTVTQRGATRWAGSASFLAIALWLAVPPLLLFVAWWRGRPARAADPRADSLGGGDRPALGGGSGLGPREARGRSARVRPE